MTLTPPPAAPEAEATKRSEAVFRADRLEKRNDTWTRFATYCFEGDEYEYGLESFSARTEVDARRTLYGAKPQTELDTVFLRDVRLDMTRPH
jgi:hypothetical protein